MTKKDYIMIAKILNLVQDASTRAKLFVDFGYAFSEDNPRFNKNKWHNAARKD